MESFRGHVFLLMLLTVKASTDSDWGMQRDVHLDLAPGCHVPQRILTNLRPELIEEFKQRMPDSHHGVRQKRPPQPLSMDNPISFPLARPTINNIIAICHYSNLRLQYTKDMLPDTGFGHLHRQARAVNQLETWFTVCCANGTQNEELTLCCAQQAWKKSLFDFCEEELSIKTNHYHCCHKRGLERWDCFEEEAPDKLYQPSVILPSTIQNFDFNHSICQKSSSVPEITSNPEMVTEPSTEIFQLRRLIQGGRPHPHSMDKSILFPPAHPNIANILAICKNSYQRLQHAKILLPRINSEILRGQANSVSQLETRYIQCCTNGTHDEKLTLCCAQQAWEKSLSDFCKEELSVNTNPYYCCGKNGPSKWDCFKKEGVDISYQLDLLLPYRNHDFDFDHNVCPQESISEDAARNIQISFPPGRPGHDNIGPICDFRKLRPRYLTNCLPATGFDLFVHQLKAINGLEKAFGQCCKEKKDIQDCAHGKWIKMVDSFCKKIQVHQFECCKEPKGEQQYQCFSSAAPNPSYLVLNDYIHIDTPLSLDMFCNATSALQKMNLPLRVDVLAAKCCKVGDKRSKAACIQTQLEKLSDHACKAYGTDDACESANPTLELVKHNCCKKSAEGPSSCFTKVLLNYIAVSKSVNSNRKKCPILT